MADQSQTTLRTAQIGRCGELLVQYRLLLRGIESAAMTTDNGIDLVAYSPLDAKPKTIQVKTNLRPKPSGGKGALGLDWWLSEASPAELVALVDLESERVWLLRHAELDALAQQRSQGKLHFYMYSADEYVARKAKSHVREFAHLSIEARISDLFGVACSLED